MDGLIYRRLAQVCLRADIWQYVIGVQLDIASACMLAHAVGVKRVVTRQMVVCACKRGWRNVVEYMRYWILIDERLHACALWYGIKIIGSSGWMCDAVRTIKTGKLHGKFEGVPLDNLLALGGHDFDDTIACKREVLGYASMGWNSKLSDPTTSHLMCALQFNHVEICEQMLQNGLSSTNRNMYTCANNCVRLIRMLHLHNPTVVPPYYAYLNAFGTPAYDILCEIAMIAPDLHNMLCTIHAGGDGPINHEALAASIVFGNVEMFRKCSHLPLYHWLFNNIIPHPRMVEYDSLCQNLELAILCGRVDVAKRCGAIGLTEFMDAIAIEHIHPHVLEWMFIEGEFDENAN